MLKGKIKKIFSKDNFNIITLTTGKQIQYIGKLDLHNNDYIISDCSAQLKLAGSI